DPPELLAPDVVQVPATHASPVSHAVRLQHVSPMPPQPPAAPSAPASLPTVGLVEFEPEHAPARVTTRKRPANTARMRFMSRSPARSSSPARGGCQGSRLDERPK